MSWGERAACRDHHDPDLWFPAGDGSPSVAEAKRVCGRCPVRAECLDCAVKGRIEYGVWGGLTGAERDRLRGVVS